jgi:hypothetical protein
VYNFIMAVYVKVSNVYVGVVGKKMETRVSTLGLHKLHVKKY